MQPAIRSLGIITAGSLAFGALTVSASYAVDVNSIVQSSVRSAVQSSARSAVQSSVHSAVQSSVRSAVQSSVHSAVHSSVHSAVQSSVHSAVQSSVHSAAHSSVNSAVHSSLLGHNIPHATVNLHQPSSPNPTAKPPRVNAFNANIAHGVGQGQHSTILPNSPKLQSLTIEKAATTEKAAKSTTLGAAGGGGTNLMPLCPVKTCTQQNGYISWGQDGKPGSGSIVPKEGEYVEYKITYAPGTAPPITVTSQGTVMWNGSVIGTEPPSKMTTTPCSSSVCNIFVYPPAYGVVVQPADGKTPGGPTALPDGSVGGTIYQPGRGNPPGGPTALPDGSVEGTIYQPGRGNPPGPTALPDGSVGGTIYQPGRGNPPGGPTALPDGSVGGTIYQPGRGNPPGPTALPNGSVGVTIYQPGGTAGRAPDKTTPPGPTTSTTWPRVVPVLPPPVNPFEPPRPGISDNTLPPVVAHPSRGGGGPASRHSGELRLRRNPRRESHGKPPSRRQGGAPVIPANENRFVRDEILVEFRPDVSPQAVFDIAVRERLTLIASQRLELINSTINRYRILDGRSVPEVVATLARNPNIVSTQPNYLYSLQQEERASPQEPYPRARMHLDAAHSISEGGGNYRGGYRYRHLFRPSRNRGLYSR